MLFVKKIPIAKPFSLILSNEAVHRMTSHARVQSFCGMSCGSKITYTTN